MANLCNNCCTGVSNICCAPITYCCKPIYNMISSGCGGLSTCMGSALKKAQECFQQLLNFATKIWKKHPKTTALTGLGLVTVGALSCYFLRKAGSSNDAQKLAQSLRNLAEYAEGQNLQVIVNKEGVIQRLAPREDAEVTPDEGGTGGTDPNG